MKASKITLITLFIICSFVSHTQVAKKTIDKVKFGTTTCTYEQEVNVSTMDTTYRVWLSFQNSKYQHIVDMGIVGIYSNRDKEEFLKNLNMCLPFMEEKSQAFRVGIFHVEDWAKALFITAKGGEYTFLSKKNTLKLKNWIESVDFN